MEFVNRFAELTDLRRVLRSPRPALVRVYGRRRLGKTELLRKLCREEEGLYLLVDEADAIQQRASLSSQLAQQDRSLEVPIASWDALFDLLLRVGRKFVVLDEFQRLLVSDPLAVSRLQHRWDTEFKESGPSLVLCGSSIGMMQRLTTRRAAPLFGRLTADLRVRPFGYAATRLLYPGEDEEERVRRYAVFGGTPYYHEFSVGRSLEEAVRDSFLLPTSPLIEEPQNLLRLELQSPLRHNSILYEIGQGTHGLRELETKVGVQKGGLGPYLQTLRYDMDLVAMEDPVCGILRHARYVLTDPFFHFYFRFIFENRPRLELGRGRTVWSEIERQLDSFLGFVFERVAREALTLLNGGTWEGVSIDFDKIGRWWSRQGEEVDIVAAGKTEVIVGEVSFSQRPMELSDLRKLETKISHMERLAGRPIRLLLVSRSGFGDGVEEEMRRKGGLLLTLQDLVRVYDEGYRPSSG